MSETCTLARSISALDAMFAFLERRFTEHAVGERTAFCVNLAAEEIFTNMVRHNVSGSESIDLEVEITGDCVYLDLIDRDVEPWDPSSVPDPGLALPVRERTPGGLGVHLVRSVVDRVTYEYDDREMRVKVEKQRD